MSDPFARVAEIRQGNRRGDVSRDDVAWLCDEVSRLLWVERRCEDVKEALEGKSSVDATLVRRLL